MRLLQLTGWLLLWSCLGTVPSNAQEKTNAPDKTGSQVKPGAQDKSSATPKDAGGKRAQAKAAPGRNYPPELPGAKTEVYKTVGDVKLNLYVYPPSGHRASDKSPAIVFFFGGGWRNGSPTQFQHQCEYLASRGMVAITADYRVASRHDVKAVDCVRDAKSAIRFVRQQASRLGIDPHRVAAAGGSAGGHIAACTGIIPGLDEAGEDVSVSSRPDAMVLFNPALVLAAIPGRPQDSQKIVELSDRMGVEPVRVSPYHHVKSGRTSTVIFHGKDDTTVPYGTVDAFASLMKKEGNRCELVGYDGQQHGFFNFGRSENEYYRQTVRAMDEFLVSLGYLTGKPTVE